MGRASDPSTLESSEVPRRPCNFRQSELTRALKGVRAAGIEIHRIEIDRDGKIIVLLGTPTAASDENAAERSEWEEFE